MLKIYDPKEDKLNGYLAPSIMIGVLVGSLLLFQTHVTKIRLYLIDKASKIKVEQIHKDCVRSVTVDSGAISETIRFDTPSMVTIKFTNVAYSSRKEEDTINVSVEGECPP